MTRAAPCLASSLPTQFLALSPARRLISGVFIYRHVVVSLEQCATEETLPALRYVAKAEGGSPSGPNGGLGRAAVACACACSILLRDPGHVMGRHRVGAPWIAPAAV